jgi:hypothetical protein
MNYRLVIAMHNGTPILYKSDREDSRLWLGVFHSYLMPNEHTGDQNNLPVYGAIYQPVSQAFMTPAPNMWCLDGEKFDYTKTVSFAWRDLLPDHLLIHYGSAQYIHNLRILIRLGALHNSPPIEWPEITTALWHPERYKEIDPVSCWIGHHGERSIMDTTTYTIESHTHEIAVKVHQRAQHIIGPAFYFDAHTFKQNGLQVWQQRTIQEIEMAIQDYEIAAAHLPDNFDLRGS